jgi:glycosyltransferase involved in cell wall biosynthesis
VEEKAKRVNICFVNTTDLIGGAERCSFDLHRGLRARGHKTSLVVGRRLSEDPDVYPCHYPMWDAKARTLLHLLGFTDTMLVTPLRVIRQSLFRDADVVNIHNMHGCFWNFWTVPILARSKHVVLTLHDEWLYTGDCVYTYDCDRWQHKCGSCPQMANEFRPDLGGRDLTRFNLELKRAALRVSRPDRVHLVSPSHWLAAQVAKTPLRRFPVSVIPNGVDPGSFQPRDRRQAKASFNVPEDRFCFLFLAANLTDPRKGVARLTAAIQEFGLPQKSVLLLAGRGSEELARTLANPAVISAGYLSGIERISDCYAAADCMLLLSDADNLPYAAIEAAASGCPVIALGVGGIPEVVLDGVTGRILSQSSKPGALSAAMADFAQISPEAWNEMSRRSRIHARQNFSDHSFIQGYEGLFTGIVEKHRSGQLSTTPQ